MFLVMGEQTHVCYETWVYSTGSSLRKQEEHKCLRTNLQRAVARIRGNRGLVKDADCHLRVRRL